MCVFKVRDLSGNQSPDCLAGIHPCFVCKLSEGEVLPASPAKGWVK
jgi:hypothetical protein